MSATVTERPTELSGLVPLARYAEARPHVFQSQESVRWFVRRHRGELAESGALLMVAGRWFADAPVFDRVVAEVGRRAARGGAA